MVSSDMPPTVGRGAMHYLEEKMSRIKDLQKQVHKTLKNMDDNQKRAAAIAHLH